MDPELNTFLLNVVGVTGVIILVAFAVAMVVGLVAALCLILRPNRPRKR